MLDKRRDKKQRRAEKWAAQSNGAAKAPTGKDDEEEEEDDFEAEYKMLKKLKSGKVTAAEFDAAIQLDDLQSDEG